MDVGTAKGAKTVDRRGEACVPLKIGPFSAPRPSIHSRSIFCIISVLALSSLFTFPHVEVSHGGEVMNQ